MIGFCSFIPEYLSLRLFGIKDSKQIESKAEEELLILEKLFQHLKDNKITKLDESFFDLDQSHLLNSFLEKYFNPNDSSFRQMCLTISLFFKYCVYLVEGNQSRKTKAQHLIPICHQNRKKWIENLIINKRKNSSTNSDKVSIKKISLQKQEKKITQKNPAKKNASKKSTVKNLEIKKPNKTLQNQIQISNTYQTNNSEKKISFSSWKDFLRKAGIKEERCEQYSKWMEEEEFELELCLFLDESSLQFMKAGERLKVRVFIKQVEESKK